MELDYNTIVQKTLDEYSKLITQVEYSPLDKKYPPVSYWGFINSIKACYPDFNETYYLCYPEKQNNLSFSNTLTENKTRVLQTSECGFITGINPPYTIKNKEKCNLKNITDNHTCFIVDSDPLTYIVLSNTINQIYLLTAEVISSISIRFSRVLQEIQKTKNSLIKKEEEYKDFIHYVSHGLKTPLTSILGFSNLLAKGINSLNIEEINSYGERILNISKQMNRTLNELVNLFRIKPQLEKTNVLQTLNNILKKHSKDLEEKNFKLDIKNEFPVALISHIHLAKIFESIIKNCIEFCPRGSRITINFVDEEIIISDNGPGISPKLLKSVTQPFISTKPTSSMSTGMGLFTVKKIVEFYNGSFSIESKYGYGTTVRISLPMLEK